MIFVYIQSDLNFFLSTYSFRYEKTRKNQQEKKNLVKVVESVHNKETKAKEEFYLMLSCLIIR